MVRRSHPALGLVSIAVLASISCTHNQHTTAIPARPAKTSNTGSAELAEEISSQLADQYEAVSDFKATVVLSAALGKPQNGKVKRYSGIRGYILFRKPAEIRIIGSGPFLAGRMFDLVSDGVQFRLSVPAKKRFVVGPSDYPGRSSDKFENIRPQHLVEVLLPKPVDRAGETVALEEAGDGSSYTLRLIHTSPPRRPSRTLWVEGAGLRVTRELVFTEDGKTLTDARFSQWMESDNVLFPRQIEIERPQEEYQLVIQIQKVEINRRLKPEVFVLEQPPGTQLVRLGPPA